MPRTKRVVRQDGKGREVAGKLVYPKRARDPFTMAVDAVREATGEKPKQRIRFVADKPRKRKPR